MEKYLENFLVSAPVFCRLDENQRRTIGQSAVRKHCREGDYLAHYGDVWPYVFVVMTGAIAVRKLSAEGRCMGALRLKSDQIFWSPTIFDGGPIPAFLEAREESEVFLWRQDNLLPIVQLNCEALWDLCSILVGRIRQASQIVEDLAFQTVGSRLAGLLFKQYQEKTDLHIPRELTLAEMAEIVGTTPVMVCKILSNFAAEGIITVKRTEFELVQPEALGKLVGGNK